VSPLTLPSHASLFTAAFPPAHGVRDNTIYALPADATTYATLLQKQGYSTAAFVSSVVLDDRYGLAQGFTTYDDDTRGQPERAARDTLARARQWMSEQPASSRQFVWIHLFEPHAPYLSGSYEAEVTTADRELDGFFGWLRERGVWNDLVVSVTSDHGESLGEHGEATHGFFVYDSTIRIPWILKAPGVQPARIPHQVRLIDVMPTTVAAAGVKIAVPPGADGIDLMPFVANGSSPGLEAYAETFLPHDQFQWSELRAIRTERMKYIAAPKPELYDVASDAAESRNVMAERGDEANRLRRILEALESRQRAAPRTTADPMLEERFMALGYIGFSPATDRRTSALPDPKDKLEIYTLTMSALEVSEADRPADALALLARAERLDPKVTQVHYLKGSILGTQARYAEAAAALERAVALNPRHVTARFRLALAYVRLSQLERAEKILRGVIADEPRNARAYHNLAAIAYTRGDLRNAEVLERQALEIDRSYFEAWNTLGAVHLMAKRPRAALDALTTAIRLKPDSGEAQYNLALALRATGQPAAAESAAARACALDRRYCPQEERR
jgi:tetratricopeptide (TPR) repeat protein